MFLTVLGGYNPHVRSIIFFLMLDIELDDGKILTGNPYIWW